MAALQLLAVQRFQRGEYREGEKFFGPCWPCCRSRSGGSWPSNSAGSSKPPASTRKREAWNFLAWAFATSPEPHILDPEAAMVFAQRVVKMTKQQDPLSLDTLAAAQAANGQFGQAVQTAQAAINLANSQGNKPLAEAISRRLPFYQQGKPYRCDPSGSDRPYAAK